MNNFSERFERLYESDRKKWIKKINRLVGGVDNAEDVIHDAVLRAYKYGEKVEVISIAPWFGRILMNAALDYNKRERLMGMTVEYNEEVHLSEDVFEENERGEALLERVSNDIAGEKLSNQEILQLYFIHGYKLREINEIVDENYRQVANIVQRFTAKLREKYGESGMGC